MNLVIDDLTYAYNANQLTKVDDAGNAMGFTDVGASTDYTYDANGNLITDMNKGITNIIYNYLNLPEVITLTGGTITFLYDANGNKLRKTVSGSSQDYLGGIEYKNNVVEAVYHEEGRATPSGSAWQYEYYLKDHLGNTRVIFSDSNDDGTPEIIQEADYYPFGMRHQNATATNHYLYNGKELNTDLGLDWYDYGFRWYDAELGRFPSVDPIADRFPFVSPFNYAENRVPNGIDLWGLQFVYFNKKDVTASVVARKANPNLVDQGRTPTCGMAVCANILAKKDPVGYDKLVMDLWSTGKGSYNGYDVKPDKHLFKMSPTDPQYPYSSASYAADWILLSSLRDNENDIWDYDGQANDFAFWGSTSIGTLKRMMRDFLGLKNVTSHNVGYLAYGSDKANKTLTDMQKRFSAGEHEAMFINAGMLSSTPTNSSIVPDHWIVFNGNFSTSTSGGITTYTFDVFTWGRNQTVTLTENQFNKNFYGSISGK